MVPPEALDFCRALGGLPPFRPGEGVSRRARVKTSQTPAVPLSRNAGGDGDRLVALDTVRGVAVLGILAANIVGMGQPMAAAGWPGGFLEPPRPVDDWLWGAQLVLVDGKFRGLFTVLFGAGMVLFARSAAARGLGDGLLARRLGWLALFGIAHWALLWRGDILLTYAVAGFVALPMLAWPAARQLTLGLIGYLVGAAMIAGVTAALTMIDPGGLADIVAEERADGRAEAALVLAGDHGAVVAHALSAHLSDLVANVLWALFETVPLLLIGVSLVQFGLFDGGADPRRQRRWGWTLWLGGTAATIGIAWAALQGGIRYPDAMRAAAWTTFPALAATLGLMALLALWGQSAKGWLADRLAEAGRCAFSNYIGSSALALAVFSGWGLGLFGQLGRLQLYGVMLVFWLIMLGWPKYWLARFRHGPLEWLWRCLTYGTRLPLRR